MSELFENLFVVIAFVIYIAVQLRKAKRAREAQGASEQLPEFIDALQRAASQAGHSPRTVELEPIDAALEHLRQAVGDFRNGNSGLGAFGSVLESALEEAVTTPLEDISGRWREVRALADAGHPPSNLPRHVDATTRWITELRRRLGALQRVSAARSDRATASLLDDADAIARAFFAPIAEFAEAHGVDIPQQRPLTVPVHAGVETWTTALPNRPIIGVPRDFGDDLFWWTAVPHEIAHVVWERVPGLADEFYRALGLTGTTRVLDPSREHIMDLSHRLVRAWAPELFADWLTVLMAGPAAVHGMLHVFSTPGARRRLLSVAVAQDGDYDPHPPSHLRVLVACRLLGRMGFTSEAAEMERRWRREHRDPGPLVVPLAAGQRVQYGADELAEYVAAFASVFYEHQFDSLAGRSFESINGLEMSPGLWAKARRNAARLAAGEPFHDDPRIVVAAAIEARYRHPETSRTIRDAVREAIVGLSAPLSERRVRQVERARGGRYTRREFRDALVWMELLERPGAHGAPGRGSTPVRSRSVSAR